MNLLKNFEEYLGAVILVGMTGLTVVNVFSRFLLKASIAVTDELTTCFFVLLSLLGAAVCTKRGAHLGLTLLTDRMGFKNRRRCALIASFLGAFFCGVVVVYGIDMVIHEYVSEQLTLGMGWPEWIFGSFVPFGGALICLRFIQAGIAVAKKKEQ